MNRATSYKATRLKILAGHFIGALAQNSSQPLLPVIKADMGLSVLQASAFPMVLFFSSMIANVIAGAIIAKIGQRRLILVSLVTLLVGILGALLFQNYALFLLSYGLIGFSIGWAFTGFTTLYSTLPEELQNFGLYHSLFGLGGMVAPLFLNALTAAGFNYHYVFFGYAILLLVLILSFIRDTNLRGESHSHHSIRSIAKVFSMPLVLLSLVAFSAYASAEIGISNLSALFSVENYGKSEAFAGTLLTVFWLLFTVSRFSSDWLAKKIGSIRFAAICASLAAIALIAWLLGASPWLIVLVGLMFGPMFPVLQKYLNSHLSPERRGMVNGTVYAATSLAATVLLPFMGRLGDVQLSLAYVPPIALMVAFAVLMLFIKRRAG